MTSSKPYTYHLPYSVRRDLCNILDADRSWQVLGGNFMSLDATQLALIGQAYLRNASPSEELLRKLDSANVKIIDLCNYLQHMQHKQALNVLRQHMNNCSDYQLMNNHDQVSRFESILTTPTPSFADIQPAALMNSAEFDLLVNSGNFNNNPNDWEQLTASSSPKLEVCGAVANLNQLQQNRCHKTGAINANHHHHIHNQQDDASIKEANDAKEHRLPNLLRNKTRQRRAMDDREVEDQLKFIVKIPYSELIEACDNFADSNQLGKGGFAKVYCGFWKGTHVAIKRLGREHIDQALNEFLVLNKHKIDNILPLYGISIDGPEACLVSQFMINGSLEDRLACKNSTPPLSWQLRAKIAEGVAKGLYYLHTVWPGKPLIHGDIKPANVLLDSQFEPKLADFGMARQLYMDNQGRGGAKMDSTSTHCTVSSVQGTSVYLPHEFLVNKKLSEAVDVYSYGIVMLEMATGKQALVGKQPLIEIVEDEMKLMQARSNDGQPSINYNLKDPRLNDDDQEHAGSSVGLRIWFELLLRLGINCSRRQKSKRPNMGHVLNHFAQFRNYLASSPPDTPIMNHLLDQNISSSSQLSSVATTATAATSRTLTPELSALDPNFHPLNNQFQLVNSNNNQQNCRLQTSALMSVEEEQSVHHQQQQVGDNQAGRADNVAAVDDMIPLLTELGFETSPPSQKDQQT